jgi:PAS domain S-box-containing protein
MSVMDIHPKGDLPAVLKAFHAIAEGDFVVVHDIPMLRKDGSVFYADIGREHIVYSGRPSVAGFFRDITERKRVEEKLRQNRDELQTIYDSVVDGIIIVDAKTTHPIRTNAAYCDWLGYSEEEVYATSPDQVHSAEVMPRVWDHLGTVKKGLVARSNDLQFSRKDGANVYADVISRPIFYDSRPCWISFFHDVTERKRAGEALRQSHDELRVIYDGMADGLLVTDIETLQFVRANASVCGMLGYSETELRSLSVKDLHPVEALPHILENIRSPEEVKPTNPASLPVLRKDGSTFYAEVIGRFLIYDGRPCSMGIFRDITERIRAQEALERQHRTLRHLLQSSDHERQVIAYEVHDGLAQYLTGAIMQFETYRNSKERNPKDAAKAFDAGMTMLRQGHFEARRLISGVRPPILDESGVVAAIVHLINEERLRNGPEVEFRGQVSFDRLAPILENAIYRIVQEGLTNACRHSKSKGVRVELVQHGEDLCIKIQDWGIGFDPDQVDDDRFGLQGIRERAKLLGGSLTVDSKPEQGTCITVDLPSVLSG